jgi:hypothetical protein
MKKMGAVVGVILGMVVILSLSGCASYTAQHVDQKPLNAFTKKVDNNGIVLAVDPITDGNEVTKIFTANTNSKGYLPIEIVVNNTSSDNLMLDASNISLTDVSGNIKNPVKSDIVADNFEHNKMAEAFWGFGMFSYQAADDANKKMHQDWADKSLPASKVLNPNAGNARGIVFFQLNANNVSGSTLTVPVTNLKTNTVVQLQVKL